MSLVESTQEQLDDLRERVLGVERWAEESRCRHEQRFELLHQLSARFEEFMDCLEEGRPKVPSLTATLQTRSDSAKETSDFDEGSWTGVANHDKTDWEHAELHEVCRRLQDVERRQQKFLSFVAKWENSSENWNRMYVRLLNQLRVWEGASTSLGSNSPKDLKADANDVESFMSGAEDHGKVDWEHAAVKQFQGRSPEAVSHQALEDLSETLQLIHEALLGRRVDASEQRCASTSLQDASIMTAAELDPSRMELAEQFERYRQESQVMQESMFRLDLGFNTVLKELHGIRQKLRKSATSPAPPIGGTPSYVYC